MDKKQKRQVPTKSVNVNITGCKKCMRKIKKIKNGLRELRDLMKEISELKKESQKYSDVIARFRKMELEETIAEKKSKKKLDIHHFHICILKIEKIYCQVFHFP